MPVSVLPNRAGVIRHTLNISSLRLLQRLDDVPIATADVRFG